MKLLDDLDNLYQTIFPYALGYYLGYALAVVIAFVDLVIFFFIPTERFMYIVFIQLGVLLAFILLCIFMILLKGFIMLMKSQFGIFTVLCIIAFGALFFVPFEKMKDYGNHLKNSFLTSSGTP